MKRALSFVLAIIFIFSLSACEKPRESAKEFSLGGNYYIIRSEDAVDDKSVVAAMNYISDAIESAYGVQPPLSDDWHKKNSPIVPYEYEILVGSTNREDSIEFEKALKINDYGYYIKNENVIVVCGGSPEATLEAAKKFCLDMLAYDGKASGSAPVLSEGASYIHQAKYKYTGVTLNGTPIEDFTIAIPNQSNINVATELVKKLAEYNGHKVPIKKYSELTGDERGVICIGASSREGRADASLGQHTFEISSASDASGITIAINNAHSSTFPACISSFGKKISVRANDTNAVLSIAEDAVISSHTFDGVIPTWEKKSEKAEKICDGVDYLEQLYYDENGLPYRVYALFVDPEAAWLYMGSTGDGYDYSLDGIKKENVVDHMKGAEKNGVYSIAAVNGDFFAISEDYRPRGLTIKEGIVVGENTSRSWVGYTYDGKMVIGTSNDYKDYEGKLRTAVGGRQIVLANGSIATIDLGTDFGDTPHPRTLAGYKKDGTMILAVVDGRQKSVSNGAPLARCALLMQSLGADTAINLDGGGSSCLIIRRGDDKFETMNSPSDGVLRKVYNSILVVPYK